ncbi:glycerol kinase GlpK [Kordiimonas aquimaris]|uniref:glycerol kinase GlpK n=1 Tax=Kordiimonas aquimaris TaxID=707591 RepID=UPI0021CECBEF|nr:glycerol kinase GlpK [Kordiimonas aquimaris]
MAGKDCVLAIDQGTTSSRAMVFDRRGAVIATSQYEFTQYFPSDGYVEHDPDEIWKTTLKAAQDVVTKVRTENYNVTSIGITNQRETSVVWDKKSGEVIHNAIVWQDRRTAPVCRRLTADGCGDMVQAKTGLLLDPYFSATKAAWIIDNVRGARKRAEAGELAFGTIDSFLIWRLTGGKVHATDATNASRTSLFNIETQNWDEELLTLFRVPASMLPEVKDCAADFGATDASLFGKSIPILGVAGDQQAAAIGQCCFHEGSIKSTYGTGCFVLVNTGNKILRSQNRLLSTVAYRLNGKPSYALEGSIFVAGAAVQWLRDGIQIIDSAPESEALAETVRPGHGVYMVPAFTGLGAPYWDPDARAAVLGMTRATGRAELASATLESICYQTYDLLAAMERDGVKPNALRVDGGMVANNWMNQFLANVLNLPVERPKVMETTALGAAYLAALQTGVTMKDIESNWSLDRKFTPEPFDSSKLLAGWHKAVECVRSFS